MANCITRADGTVNHCSHRFWYWSMRPQDHSWNLPPGPMPYPRRIFPKHLCNIREFSLCTLRVCTLGFGSLVHGIVPLMRAFGTRSIKGTNLKALTVNKCPQSSASRLRCNWCATAVTRVAVCSAGLVSMLQEISYFCKGTLAAFAIN